MLKISVYLNRHVFVIRKKSNQTARMQTDQNRLCAHMSEGTFADIAVHFNVTGRETSRVSFPY